MSSSDLAASSCFCLLGQVHVFVVAAQRLSPEAGLPPLHDRTETPTIEGVRHRHSCQLRSPEAGKALY